MKTRNQKWQYRYKWMDIGRLSTPYSEAGALREEEADANSQLSFPAVEKNAGNKRAESLWISATNFTDEEGVLWPVKIAHVGPRTIGAAQFFKREFKTISRFLPPEVYVNGERSFRRWVVVEEVDAAMMADRQVYNRNTNRVGIQTEVNIYAFDQQYHDNYHIIEYTFKNIGDVDEDLDVELPDQVLNGVYFFWCQRYGLQPCAAWITDGGAAWGQFTMNDAVGDGHEDYGVDFTAQYAWAGFVPGQTEFGSLGRPMWREHADDWIAVLAWRGDTLGRLAAGHMVGRIYLHADSSADDPKNAVITTAEGTWPDGAAAEDLAGRQPSTMGMFNSDHADLVEGEYDESLMLRQYNEHMNTGRYYPHHADYVEPSDAGVAPGQYFTIPRNDPSNIIGIHDWGGWQFTEGFGPYTMDPGDDVRLVIAEGVAGLSDSAKLAIGVAYKASGADDELLIEWPEGSGVELTKNEWVLSTKDSLFQMFERAKANWESGMDIPRAPLPPAKFNVDSRGEIIELSWETYPGEPDPVKWEIWRTKPIFYHSPYYERIKTLDGSARGYIDSVAHSNGPIMGLEHFYYLTAVGPEVTDPTLTGTPTSAVLQSNRYYTQTYFPVMAGRYPDDEMANIVIVPNPFHIGSEGNIRYPDVRDKLGFLDIPGFCTIKIYTQLGELIDTIEHDDDTGDEYWDHTTTSRQLVASGLYIVVFEEKDASGVKTGKKEIRKFVIIH